MLRRLRDVTLNLREKESDKEKRGRMIHTPTKRQLKSNEIVKKLITKTQKWRGEERE